MRLQLLAATGLAWFAILAAAALAGRGSSGLPDILVDVHLGGKMKINTANGPMLVSVGEHMTCKQCPSLAGRGAQSLAACPCSVPVGGMKDGVGLSADCLGYQAIVRDAIGWCHYNAGDYTAAKDAFLSMEDVFEGGLCRLYFYAKAVKVRVEAAVALNEAEFKGRQLKVVAKRTNAPGMRGGRGRGRGRGRGPPFGFRGRGKGKGKGGAFYWPRGRGRGYRPY